MTTGIHAAPRDRIRSGWGAAYLVGGAWLLVSFGYLALGLVNR